MVDRPSLPKDQKAKLDALLKQAGEAERGGDLARSVTFGQQAWDDLPSTKTNWDFYPQIIARGMLRKAAVMKDRKQVGLWLDRTYDAYADPTRNNHLVNMLEGVAWLAVDDEDAAYAIFDRIYQRDGDAGFPGDDRKHLDWLLKQKAHRHE